MFKLVKKVYLALLSTYLGTYFSFPIFHIATSSMMFDENYLAKYSSKFAIIFLRTHTDIRPYNKIKEYFVMTLGEFPGMIQIFRRTLTTHYQHAQKILKYIQSSLA